MHCTSALLAESVISCEAVAHLWALSVHTDSITMPFATGHWSSLRRNNRIEVFLHMTELSVLDIKAKT